MQIVAHAYENSNINFYNLFFIFYLLFFPYYFKKISFENVSSFFDYEYWKKLLQSNKQIKSLKSKIKIQIMIDIKEYFLEQLNYILTLKF